MRFYFFYSFFYFVFWKFWRLNFQQKYAHFFQTNGNPTRYFWGIFLNVWMVYTLFHIIFVDKIWSLETPEQIVRVVSASLILVELTYQAGLFIFFGIGLGHFVYSNSSSYKSKSFLINFLAAIGISLISFLSVPNQFLSYLAFSLSSLIIQIIGFICIVCTQQLLSKKIKNQIISPQDNTNEFRS